MEPGVRFERLEFSSAVRNAFLECGWTKPELAALHAKIFGKCTWESAVSEASLPSSYAERLRRRVSRIRAAFRSGRLLNLLSFAILLEFLSLEQVR
jgi:hypothetical protein